MKIKRSTLKNIGFVSLVIVVLIVFILLSQPQGNQNNVNGVSSELGQDGNQIININVRGGYTPNIISAKANTPATLNMITKNTFDCSTSLVIPKLNIRKNLPTTGITAIDIPSQQAGTIIDATCSMGMYSFKITFN